MLYPLKFKTIYKSKVWGGNKIRSIKNDKKVPDKCGESWEISAVEGNISVVSNGFLKGNSLQEIIEIYMGDLVGDKVFDKFSYEFPLLVKIIDANDNLSVQVHPDNKIAKERHNAWGKSEVWYILEAENNSKLISGFNRNVSSKILMDAIESRTFETIVNQPIVKQAEVYSIPAGRLHSLGKGLLLVEIQQTSDITYRVYDYDRKENRELHLDLAEDVIDYKQTENIKTSYTHLPDKSNPIIKNENFTLNFLPLMNSLTKDYFKIDSFVIYFCINGKTSIKYDNGSISIEKGELILIPAELKSVVLIPEKYSELLEVYLDL
jgi:mannose-6-phosphate isomerase